MDYNGCDIIIEILLSFIGSLCAGIFFNIKKENLFWTGISGMLGWLVYSLFYEITNEVIVPSFMGAIIVGLYSELAARKLKSPATIFSVTGMFPIVPGIAAYNTIQYIVEDKLQEALDKAVETFTAAIVIAFGLLLMSAVFRFYNKLKNN